MKNIIGNLIMLALVVSFGLVADWLRNKWVGYRIARRLKHMKQDMPERVRVLNS